MKVLVVSQAGYPSRRAPLRAIFVHELCRKLLRRGIPLSVATSDYFSGREEYDGVRVYRVRRHFLASLALVLSRERPHLLHIHFADSAIAGVLVGKAFRRPVIIHGHRDDVDSERSLKIRSLRALSFKLCDTIVLASAATKELALQSGAPEAKCRVVYNSADESRYINKLSRSDARSALNLPQEPIILLSVGHLIRRKGFEYLIRAVSILKNPAVSIIVGSGAEKPALEKLMKELGLDSRIKFWGRADSEDLVRLYKAANIFVHPSLHEGHAMALLEAMASGLPVIATAVPGNLETVKEGVNGFFVAPEDFDALGKAIDSLASDPSLMERMGASSIKIYAASFGEAKQIGEIVRIYSELCGFGSAGKTISQIVGIRQNFGFLSKNDEFP